MESGKWTHTLCVLMSVHCHAVIIIKSQPAYCTPARSDPGDGVLVKEYYSLFARCLVAEGYTLEHLTPGTSNSVWQHGSYIQQNV